MPDDRDKQTPADIISGAVDVLTGITTAEDVDVVAGQMQAAKDSMLRKEASAVLSWLNENRCIKLGAFTKVLAAIEAGDHRL